MKRKNNNFIEKRDGETITQYDEALFLKLYPFEHFLNKTIGGMIEEEQPLPSTLAILYKHEPTLWKLKRFWRCKR